MTIYVVTSGYYSDYSIEAVFLDKEKAEYYAKFHACEGGSVESYETADDDYMINTRIINFYDISMHGDGTITEIINNKYEYTPENNKFTETFKGTRHGFVGRIIAESEEQAKKIMLDKRACWLAEKYGIKV